MWRIASLVFGLMISCLLMALLVDAGGFLDFNGNEIVSQDTALAEDAAEPQKKELHLPHQIPGTTLIVEHFVSYEGPFIEDGSDEPVSNIMALVLRNVGEKEIEETEVTLEREGERLTFCANNILPDMSVMVLEREKKSYSDGGITASSGWQNTADSNGMWLEYLKIDTLDMGTLEITNLNNGPLTDIYLYHKNYLPDGTYVGGISYKTYIARIEPGESICIQPEHYADGYSRIFKAE